MYYIYHPVTVLQLMILCRVLKNYSEILNVLITRKKMLCSVVMTVKEPHRGDLYNIYNNTEHLKLM